MTTREDMQLLLHVAEWTVQNHRHVMSTIRELAGTEENYLIIARELDRVKANIARARSLHAEATLTLVEWLVIVDSYTWVSGAKKPDIGMMGNGLLAGLVAITAPSGYVSPLFACIIGAIAGVLVVFFAGVIEKVMKVDDPVGAIAVHGVNGAWGQLSVGLFADGLANYAGLQVHGVFFGDPGQLVAQIIGTVVCFVYVFGISWIFFALYKKLFGLRVSAATELRGLDIPEMGSLGYNPDAEFYEPPVAVAASISGGGA